MPGSPRPVTSARLRLVALSVVALLAAVGCSDDDGGDIARTTTTERTSTTTTSTTASSTTTTTEPRTPEQEVEAAYLNIIDAYYRRLLQPDPDDPSIRMLHSGDSLETVIERNRTRSEAGEVARFSNNGPPTPQVLQVDIVRDGLAVLRNCLIDDVQIVRAADEKVVDDEVVSFVFRSEMRLTDGTWKLDKQLIEQEWKDGSGCDR